MRRHLSPRYVIRGFPRFEGFFGRVVGQRLCLDPNLRLTEVDVDLSGCAQNSGGIVMRVQGLRRRRCDTGANNRCNACARLCLTVFNGRRDFC